MGNFIEISTCNWYRKALDTERPRMCSPCLRASTYISQLNTRYCLKAFRYSCTSFSTRKFTTPKRTYECSGCGRSFRQSTKLVLYAGFHTIENLQCSQGRKTINCTSTVTQHQTVHTGERPQEYDESGRAFGHGCQPCVTSQQRLRVQTLQGSHLWKFSFVLVPYFLLL